MMKHNVAGGDTFTSLRMSAPMRPACSATPTPIMATKMTATTLKFAKFCTNEVKRNRMPSTVEEAFDLGGLGDDLELDLLVARPAGTCGSGTIEPPT